MARFSRSDVNARAAASLKNFITNEVGTSVRTFAGFAGIPASTLRHFINNTSQSSSARHHKRGPYQSTLVSLLKLNLPDELRAHLLDAIEYDNRVVRAHLVSAHDSIPVQS
jgi:hypothetical protein